MHLLKCLLLIKNSKTVKIKPQVLPCLPTLVHQQHNRLPKFILCGVRKMDKIAFVCVFIDSTSTSSRHAADVGWFDIVLRLLEVWLHLSHIISPINYYWCDKMKGGDLR